MIKNIFFAMSIAVLLISCNTKKENNSENSIVLEDTKGNKVELKDIAKKVVCLFDPSIDVIFMLQKQDALIGVNAELYYDDELYDYYKLMDIRIENKTLATPGSNDKANVESIVALDPDLVIAQQLSPSIINTLNGMGIAVYLSSSDTYENLKKEMKDISMMLGTTQRGDELLAYADVEEKNILNKSKQNAHHIQKTVYFSWANGRIFTTTGRNSMMNNCLELADVQNICPTHIDNMTINPETLIKWNPDMIVMWNDSPDLFYDKTELKNITAIKEKQIYNLMPMFFYNPHTLKALCAAVRINSWAYASTENNNNNQEVKEIIIKLYGEEMGDKLTKDTVLWEK